MNLILKTDSYKASHYEQYPDWVSGAFAYFESRGGAYDRVVPFGMQALIREYLTKPITVDDVNEAREIITAHGEPFNEKGWMEIVDADGVLPLEICALPEGLVVPTGVALFTVENCCPGFGWLVGYMETLLSNLWYPCTVATKALHVRRALQPFYEKTGYPDVSFSYHNFGARGSTCEAAAAIGGAAHLTSFMGTDNLDALRYIRDHYQRQDKPFAPAGFSIPATEHSTVTSWGLNHEYTMIGEFLEKNRHRPMIACVLDSYNIYAATDFVTSALRAKIESDEYPIFVMRPDSGDPVDIIHAMLDICERNKVSSHLTPTGHRMMDKYRILWGDGITPDTICRILTEMQARGYAAANFAFGSGGDLMQNVNRDTCRFAYKFSAVQDADGNWMDVYKDPITDPGKKSKRGRLTTIRWKCGWDDKKIHQIQTIKESDFDPEKHEKLLRPVFEHGMIRAFDSFDDIRARTKEAK